jgi:hypothetical protein
MLNSMDQRKIMPFFEVSSLETWVTILGERIVEGLHRRYSTGS